MPDNPFNALLDPGKQGTITGFIGGLMGNPTAGQAAGSATGAALQELSTLRDQGLTPQQSLLKWFQTPRGQEYFTQAGPDGLKQLVDGLVATQPPSPVMHNLKPGEELYSQMPGQQPALAATNQNFSPQSVSKGAVLTDRTGKVLYDNSADNEDTPQIKNFKFFTGQLGKVPPEQLKQLAEIQLDPNGQAAKVRAVQDMVKNFGMDQRLGDAIIADTVHVMAVPGDFGQNTGQVMVYDKSNPTAGATLINPNAVNSPAGPQSSVPQLPATAPNTGAATGVLPATPSTEPIPKNRAGSIPQANPKYFGDKASMFLGTGPIAGALSAATGVTELADPSLVIPEGAKAKDRATQIDILRSDLASMGQMGDGWVNKGIIEGYLKLAPEAKLTVTPHEAVQKGIRLAEHIQGEIDAQSEVYSNKTLPFEARKKALSIIQGWQRVQRDMPTVDELRNIEGAIRNGTSGAPSPASAAKSIVETGAKAVTSIKKEATQIQQDQGLTGQPNIDLINDPKELLGIDPTKLDRANNIKFQRKLDAIMRGGKAGSVNRR